MNKNRGIELNAAQRAAVEHEKGPMMVLAGPGSGKTFVLVEHLSYMTGRLGIRPENILVITFTREAAKEMQERAVKKQIRAGITFGTFHSVFLHMLAESYGRRRILLADRRYCIALIHSLCKKAGDEGLRLATADMAEYIYDMIGQIKNGKRSAFSEEGEERQLSLIYKAYSREMQLNGRIDYDDMLYLCKRLFEQDMKMLEKFRKKYKYILIDEFQDINSIQFEIIRMLAYPENNLFIVGDDDQSIYGFRGSCPELMLGFDKVYRDTARVLLDINYRSSEAIVRASLSVIGENRSRFKKALRAASQGGRPVRVAGFENEAEMMRALMTELRLMRAGGKSCMDTAVLYRVNKNAALLINYLRESGISYSQNELKEGSLPIMTFHASKGLEFEQVYIIYAQEGITPWKAAHSEEELAEERRMFYVAMTRAKRQLHIFYTKKIYNVKSKRSRFVDSVLKSI